MLGNRHGGVRMSRQHIKYLLSLALFGSNGIVASAILLPSHEIVLLRTFLGATLLVALLALSRTPLAGREHPRQVASLAVSGAALGASWVFLFEGYKLAGVGTSTLLYYLGPVFVMGLSPIVMRQRLQARQVACFGAVLAGAFPVVSAGGVQLEPAGVLCGLGAAAFYAVMVIAGKGAPDMQGLEAATIQLVASFAVAAGYAVVTGGLQMPSVAEVAPVLMLGLVNTGLGCYLYFTAMGALDVQTVSVLGYLEPLSAVVLSALVLGEAFGPARVLGAVLVLGGAAASELVGRGKAAEFQAEAPVAKPAAAPAGRVLLSEVPVTSAQLHRAA